MTSLHIGPGYSHSPPCTSIAAETLDHNTRSIWHRYATPGDRGPGPRRVPIQDCIRALERASSPHLVREMFSSPYFRPHPHQRSHSHNYFCVGFPVTDLAPFLIPSIIQQSTILLPRLSASSLLVSGGVDCVDAPGELHHRNILEDVSPLHRTTHNTHFLAPDASSALVSPHIPGDVLTGGLFVLLFFLILLSPPPYWTLHHHLCLPRTLPWPLQQSRQPRIISAFFHKRHV